ncbi:hypothetical protein HPB50_002969 [Hyalomma asiaticum]|uniref:Uncharacterized protein n=1 Tax=Hyalomma asiaticum TaxID=266040 RepID=A0ACB7TDM9_HYAAI|nr:hypothetical protein HPB50_002969 [Hyalomma asiaticum]
MESQSERLKEARLLRRNEIKRRHRAEETEEERGERLEKCQLRCRGARGQQVRQLREEGSRTPPDNKVTLDVIEDEKLDNELESAASFNGNILFAIADAEFFLSQRQEY